MEPLAALLAPIAESTYRYELLITLICAVSYLLGSIPFGFILAKMFGLGDIRELGSGNIGATNVLRTGRKWLALTTLILDFGKSAVAVWLAGWIIAIANSKATQADSVVQAMQNMVANTNLLGFAAIAAIVGHMFPVWLKFKGGKGIACVFGVAFSFYTPLGIYCAAIWIGVFLASQMSSAAGLSMVIAFGLILYNMQPLMWIPALVIPVLVIFKHRENIARLIKGTEHKFTLPNISKSKPPSDAA